MPDPIVDSGVGSDVVQPSDSGSEASPGDGGVTVGCASSSFLLCEDFEATPEGNIPMGWTKTGTVSVSASAAHRGVHALQIGIATNGPRRINRPLGSLGANASDHWGRIFYKVKMPAPTYNGYLHSTLVAMQGKSPIDNSDIEARVVDTVQGPQSTHQFLYNVQPSNRAEFGTGSPYNWKYDASWHCAEWHVHYATQSYRFFFDGTEVLSIKIDKGANNFSGIEIPAAYASISVGWYNYQVLPNGGFEAWIDDLAIDTSQIGCMK